MVTFLLADHLGSTSVTTDTSGVLVSSMLYTAFGETRSSYGITGSDYRYTGQREESEIGLYYYNARFYDPALARFIYADTIIPQPGDPLAWDRYAYVRNNPLIYNDPSGHNGVLIAGALGGALGGAIYGYGSQVINNLNQGMGFGDALTTNISGTSIAMYTAVGALIGTGIAPAIAPVATTLASMLTSGGTAACSTGQCEKIIEPVKQTGTTLARIFGKSGEGAAGIVKNTKHIRSVLDPSRYRIPDQWRPDWLKMVVLF